MQARYWILTVPEADWNVPDSLPEPFSCIRGQLETGESTGYQHWQICVAFKRAVRLACVKRIFGRTAHAEPTRSAAAREYVWKEDTRVEGSQV